MQQSERVSAHFWPCRITSSEAGAEPREFAPLACVDGATTHQLISFSAVCQRDRSSRAGERASELVLSELVAFGRKRGADYVWRWLTDASESGRRASRPSLIRRRILRDCAGTRELEVVIVVVVWPLRFRESRRRANEKCHHNNKSPRAI